MLHFDYYTSWVFLFFYFSTNRARVMHFWTTIIILSLVTDIITHTYLKLIRMRFVSGQAILELKEIQGKTTSEKWRLPSLINSHSWEDYTFHLGKKPHFFHQVILVRKFETQVLILKTGSIGSLLRRTEAF